MQFLNPAAFYLLGVIPIVVVLHFLKLRRYTHLVPSIMHWLSTGEDRRANVPFQRLRNLLLPLLQVLFIVLLTCSVARPIVRRPGFMPGKAILIVDNSASMLSKETGQTRLTLAKQAALKQITEIFAGGGIMLMVTHASDTYIQQAFTTDTAQLSRAIENIVPTHSSRDLRPVFDAITRYADSPQDNIFFISDSFENLPDMSLPLHKIAVGADAENVGIVQFSVTSVEDLYEVLVRIQNFTDTPKEIRVQLEVEDVPLDDRMVSIAPEKTQSVLFSGDPSGLEEKIISVHLGIEDDFSLDNSASAILSGVSPLRILLVSDNQKSLLPELLSSYGKHVELNRVVPADYHGTGNADVVIFDGSTFTEREVLSNLSEFPARTGIIFINPGSDLPFTEGDIFSVETDNELTRVIRTDDAHPLMADVALQGMQVRESTYRDLPLWGHSLVETEKGSLIWIGTEMDHQVLVFEFDAFNPDAAFALTIPAGPLFVYRCLAWFEATTAPLQPLVFQEGRTRHAFRTGEQVVMVSRGMDIPHQIQKPDQTMVTPDDSIFSETDQVGIYTLFADDGRELERFTVNLLDPAESALSHSATTEEEEIEESLETGMRPIAQEMWRLPVLFAFVILFVEWWFYHRDRL